MSRCTRAERENSYTANPSWPVEICYTIDVMLNLQMGVGEGGRTSAVPGLRPSSMSLNIL